MQYRELGRTGMKVSTVSFGCWAIGGTWGKVNDDESMAALHHAAEIGVNFYDTADVYDSERLIKQLKKDHPDIYIATKAGRLLNPHVASGYNRKNLTGFIEDSLKNLGLETVDLVQLHCPPTEVYYMPEVFDIMDDLVKEGKIRYYGVSVEKVEEAIKAIEYPNVQSVQIIFNMFRHRPADMFFKLAKEKKVGIVARVPLASGMLTGKLKSDSKFEDSDHRKFNRHGEAFDRGETFSGVDYETGLKAVEELKEICPEDNTLAQFALRWILMFDEVTCTIPGAKRPSQLEENVSVADMPPLDPFALAKVHMVYEQHIKKLVHHYW